MYRAKQKTPDFRKAYSSEPTPPPAFATAKEQILRTGVTKGFLRVLCYQTVKKQALFIRSKWAPEYANSSRTSNNSGDEYRYDSTSSILSATAHPPTRDPTIWHVCRHSIRLALSGPRVDTKTNTHAPAHCCSNNIVVDVRSV